MSFNRRAYSRKYRRLSKAIGVCSSHPRNGIKDGKCKDCSRNKKRRRAERLRKGMCSEHSRSIAVVGKRLCKKCIEKRRVSYARLKYDVFSHYCKGKPRCQCSGCRTIFIGFLQMDHIKRRGKRTRLRGFALMFWFKKHKCPKGFQVLCANCNGMGGKGISRRCPMHGKKH